MTQDDPRALIRQAHLHRQSGRLEAAVAAYQRALDQGVAQPEAGYLNRSVISADDLIVGRLQRAIEAPTVATGEQASAGFVLGKLLGSCAAYDAAFVSNRRANDHSRASVWRTAARLGDY